MVSPVSQTSADRLDLLLRLTQAFNSTLDLDEILTRLMDEVIAAIRAERGFVMLFDDDGKLSFRAARGMDQRTIETPEFEISRGVVSQVAQSGQALLTSNAQVDSRFAKSQSVFFLKLRSILCAPLKVKERTLGVIYLDNRLHAGVFSPSDRDLLNAIGSSAAIAIENARLYEVAVDRGRMERELHLARQVQSSLLLHTLPQLAGWDFAARWLPAREVAGDYYDFMTPAGPAGAAPALGIVIADVTDKGMPAALFMAFSRTVVRVSVDRATSPADGITHANRLICAENTGGLFVSLFYGLLNPQTGALTYVNAGHNAPLHYRHSDKTVTTLPGTGMPLGIDANLVYAQRTIDMAAGDILLLYTDGVTDALNERQEEFGRQRLEQVVRDHPDASAIDIAGALERAVNTFTGDVPPFDDVTEVVVKRLPTTP